MNNIVNRIDLAYLPDITQETMLDVIDLNELNSAYKFAYEHKFRSFCTYAELFPFIECSHYTVPFCSVISFPEGTLNSFRKLFELGRIYEIGKKASGSEADIVLDPNLGFAINNILDITPFKELINIKFILEIETRSKEDVEKLTKVMNLHRPSFIKTSTGKRGSMSFEEKLELTKYLKSLTDLPIKYSGGIKTFDQISRIDDGLKDDRTIFGVSYSTVKSWNLTK